MYTLKSIFQTLYDKVAEIFGKISDAVSEAIGTVVSVIQGAIGAISGFIDTIGIIKLNTTVIAVTTNIYTIITDKNLAGLCKNFTFFNVKKQENPPSSQASSESQPCQIPGQGVQGLPPNNQLFTNNFKFHLFSIRMESRSYIHDSHAVNSA